jgi:hypothetical protein
MERGWDPGVKRFFLKIINSISMGLLWLLACITAGIYYKLGFIGYKPVIYTILFYTGMLVSLVLLLKYIYRLWKSE